MTQGIKTLEEVQELLRAIDRKDEVEIIDAYGDIFVTIVIGAYLNGTSLSSCAEQAYNVIKDRTGTLLPNGDFVKDNKPLAKEELISDIYVEKSFMFTLELIFTIKLSNDEIIDFTFIPTSQLPNNLATVFIGKTVSQLKYYLKTVGELV